MAIWPQESSSPEKDIRGAIAKKIILRTYTPDSHTSQQAFSSVLAHKNLRPFLLSIYNGSEFDFVLEKQNIDLELPKDDAIYASNINWLLPGFILSVAGCLSNTYIQTLSLIASIAIVWHKYTAYVFFENKVLKDNQQITIKSREQSEVIIVVDDHNFKGIFTLYLYNKQQAYTQKFRIDIIQNGCTENFEITFGESNYE